MSTLVDADMQWPDSWMLKVMYTVLVLSFWNFWLEENLLIIHYRVDSRVWLLGYEFICYKSLLLYCNLLSIHCKSLLITIDTFQATPKLSEDKVRQCVDTRLGGEYPPKAVAKVFTLFRIFSPSFLFYLPILYIRGSVP